MNGTLRNKQGCWTCRLRKKKCDEVRPQCTTCQSLSIPCYGFGPKPDWADGGEKERAVLDSLKDIVRRTSRRKGSARHPESGAPLLRIEAKKPTPVVDESVPTPEFMEVDAGSISTTPCTTSTSTSTTAQATTQTSDQLSTNSPPSITPGDSVLLVHFLDHVFPLQCPMYNPTVPEGGRGWLLALLMQTKQFYHAALALSASHRRTRTISETSRTAMFVQQEENLHICVRILHSFAQNACPKKITLGSFAAAIQVMFFELFNDHSNAWQMHLCASIDIYQLSQRDVFESLQIGAETRRVVMEDLPSPEDDPKTAEEVDAFRFLMANFVWLDIIYSVTAGRAPILLSHRCHMLSAQSQVQLQPIMGCETWVMLQIGQISELHEEKVKMIEEDHFNCSQLKSTAKDISAVIDAALSQEVARDPKGLITQMFIYMAAIYLHIIVADFEQSDLLDATFSSAIAVLRTEIPIHLLPALVPPLFVIGAVARGEDRQYFRDVLSGPPMQDPFLRHRVRILSVLEDIWRSQSTPGFTWKNCVELSKNILLV